MSPEGYVIGVRAAQHEMHSALPNAPVVPHRERRPRVRHATARVLRRIADRVEPIT
jgi:hypothetical protein